jgi:hypothetical protein
MPSNFFKFQESIEELSEIASKVPLKESGAIPDHGENRFVSGFLVLKCSLVIFMASRARIKGLLPT